MTKTYDDIEAVTRLLEEVSHFLSLIFSSSLGKINVSFYQNYIRNCIGYGLISLNANGRKKTIKTFNLGTGYCLPFFIIMFR